MSISPHLSIVLCLLAALVCGCAAAAPAGSDEAQARQQAAQIPADNQRSTDSIIAANAQCETDAIRTKAEGAIVGAAAGAAGGAAIGSAFEKTQAGAVIGAFIGLAAGYSLGEKVAKQKKRYACTNAFLSEEIARTQQANAIASKQNALLAQQVQSWRAHAQTLRARADAKQISEGELQNERKRLATLNKENQAVISKLEKHHKWQSEVLAQAQKDKTASGPYIEQLNTQIAGLEQQIQAIRASSAQLAQIDDRLAL